MQRGLRLNTGSQALWLDYFKLELQYLSKIYARRKVLGLDQSMEEEAELSGFVEDNDDHIALPKITHDEVEADESQTALLKDVEMSTLSTATDNAALQGAIPRTILLAGLKALPQRLEMLLDYYAIMASFENLPFRAEFLEDIIKLLSADERKSDPKACFLSIALPMSLLKENVRDSQFPAAFKQSIQLYQQIAPQTSSQTDLVRHWTTYLTTRLLTVPDVDPNLRKAIILTVDKAFRSCETLTMDLYANWIKFAKEYGQAGASDEIQKIATEKTGMEHFEA